MYQVIARKYRPQSFVELIGQEHVRTTLENAIAARRIAHGYIFSGQRGTGKTTVARILARCLNCIDGPTANPCGQCASCREVTTGNSPDVIEIDAASNRGINEMRELRENVRYRPARDRHKIFIIDEAHQITSEAFNALLKTLEEPPEWAVFILCTTEAHKIPSTISSRCQQFSFRSVDFEEVVARMEFICREEGIDAGPETLAVLAQAGEGSVRDSLSALDQAIACCGTTLNADEIRALLGMFSLDSLAQITQALEEQDSKRMLNVVMELERNGRNLQHFCRELARYFRNLLVAKVAGPGSRLIAATPQQQDRLASIAASFSEDDLTRYLQLTLDTFKELQFSLQPRLHLEIGLLKLIHAGRLTPIEAALGSVGGGSEPLGKPKLKSTPKPSTPAPAMAPAKAAPTAVVEPAPTPPRPSSSGNIRDRLYTSLVELGLQFTADTVAEAEIAESPGELRFVIPADCLLDANDINKALRSLGAPPTRVSITKGTPQSVDRPAPASDPASSDGEAENRARSNPEVNRFLDTFEHRKATFRNLKQ